MKISSFDARDWACDGKQGFAVFKDRNDSFEDDLEEVEKETCAGSTSEAELKIYELVSKTEVQLIHKINLVKVWDPIQNWAGDVLL